MADKATVLLTSVETAATNAMRAKEDAEAIPNLSEAVNHWIERAQEAQARAAATLAEARKNLQLSYDIGYAPFRNAPYVFYQIAYMGKSWNTLFSIGYFRSPPVDNLKRLAVDPSGGGLYFALCEGEVYDILDGYGRMITKGILVLPQGGRDERLLYEYETEGRGTGMYLEPDERRSLHIDISAANHPSDGKPAVLKSTTWDTPFYIISDRTGLKTKVNAKLYVQKDDQDVKHQDRIDGVVGRGSPERYYNKVYGVGPYDRGFLGAGADESQGVNEAVGWRGSVEKARRKEQRRG